MKLAVCLTLLILLISAAARAETSRDVPLRADYELLTCDELALKISLLGSGPMTAAAEVTEAAETGVIPVTLMATAGPEVIEMLTSAAPEYEHFAASERAGRGHSSDEITAGENPMNRILKLNELHEAKCS